MLSKAYTSGADALTVGDVSNVSIHIGGTGKLTAASATIPSLIFDADGTFQTNEGGIIASVTSTGANRGSLIASLADAGDTTLAFGGAIGAAGNANLKNLTFTGAGPMEADMRAGTYHTSITLHDVYAQSFTVTNTAVQAANDLTIHSTNLTLNNTLLNAGNSTITVAAGATVTLQNNVVIKANYINDPNTPILDLSAVNKDNLVISNGAVLTFAIANYNDVPVAGVSSMMMIDLPDNFSHNISANIVVPNGGPSGYWAYSGNGVIRFHAIPNVVTTVTAPTTSVLSGVLSNIRLPQGVSAGAVSQAAATFYSDIVSSINFRTILSRTLQLNTPASQIAYQAAVAAYANSTTDLIPPEVSANLAHAMLAQGSISADAANVLTGSTEASQRLISDMAEIGANDPAVLAEAINTLQNVAVNATNTTSSAISSRVEFVVPTVSFAPLPSSPPQPSSGAQQTNSSPAVSAPNSPSSNRVNTPTAGRNNTIQESAEEDSEEPGTDLQALALGTAAGSNSYDKFGVWGSVNKGIAHQKMCKGNPGFEALSEGMAIGVDTMINDRTIIGATISYSMNHIKHKDASRGNKTDSSSWVGAVYGNYQLRNNWFVRGTALFNRTHLNDKTFVNIVGGGKGLVQSKYNLISYGADANVGFAHRFANQIIATPSVGFRIIHSNKSQYSQFGNTDQNTTNLTQQAANNYSALAGISVSREFIYNGINITPEAHANFQYGINVKSPKGSFVSPLTPTETTNFIGTKASKLSSTYGGSLTGSGDRIEVGVSADMSLASKYIGYQGGLKLKVKF